MLKMRFALLCVLLVVFGGAEHLSAQVQIFEWSGASSNNDNWSDETNWSSSQVPTSAATTSLIFQDASLRPNSSQDLDSPFTVGNMYVNSTNISFNIFGGDLNIDNGLLTIDRELGFGGDGNTLIGNNLNFANDAAIEVLNTATLRYSGSKITQGAQSSGMTDVTGTGNIFFLDGLEELSAHLNIAEGVDVTFGTGSTPVDIANGFDTDGDVFLNDASLDFGSGANINGDLNVNFGTIQGSATINGATIISPEGLLRVEDGSTIDGSGDVAADFFGFLEIGDNATVDKSIRIGEFSEVTGESSTSTVTGDVILRRGTANGSLNFTGPLFVDSQESGDRSIISEGAQVSVSGLTTIVDAILEIGPSAHLFGPGDVNIDQTSSIDLAFGMISKNIVVEDGGMLTGNGDIFGDLTLNGLIEPGDSAGTLGIDGNITMGGTTMTCIEIGGRETGEFDVIMNLGPFNLGGDDNVASLDGELMVSLIDDFMPLEIDEFLFIDGFLINGTFSNTGGDGDFSGTFGSLNIGQGVFQVQYGPNFVRLFGFQAIPEPGTGSLLTVFCVAALARRRRR